MRVLMSPLVAAVLAGSGMEAQPVDLWQVFVKYERLAKAYQEREIDVLRGVTGFRCRSFLGSAQWRVRDFPIYTWAKFWANRAPRTMLYATRDYKHERRCASLPTEFSTPEYERLLRMVGRTWIV